LGTSSRRWAQSGGLKEIEVTTVEWQSRLKQFFSFLSLRYESQANSVVITLRLNTYFVLGAAVAAVFLTLVLKYGGISLGSALELLSDLWRAGFWLWVGMAVAFALLALAGRLRNAGDMLPTGTGFWSSLSGRLPQGPRGTALLCLALFAILILMMWAASSDTTVAPSADVQGPRENQHQEVRGEETPRLWRELQKGKRQ
jgi:hypothetical protein